jgi:hypothetical protein
MGFVVKLANLIIKTIELEKLMSESGASELFNENWNEFVSGELDTSNKTNAKSLGGRPRSTIEDDDDSNQFDVNMEKIMSRFNTFNSLMS